ncbi:MAG: eukaryotic-like serine/threonine-protein kinase [Acidobacteriota bacterium]|jgi:tetratricopeptide (TPR) repeat protein|nr:eukaryotic-like serine/threonine-protein kinase [Acidobacteriota bacterium]
MPEPDPTESILPDAPLPASIRILDPGTCLDQRFEIRRVLGVGGYAVVYLAFDRELRREVALKVLRADRMTPAALKRLRREAAVARDAASPRLVRIFDIGISDPAVYLIMEVVEGESLRERLARGPLTIDEAVRLTIQILEGLRVLHSLGIIHRDVKPGNVLLEPGGGVKLADFGLAFQSGSHETRVTVGEGVLGTLEYVSPEQALGEEVDARGDLYSLGVMLYEMLTGELPHTGKSSLGAVLGRLRAKAPDVRELRPEVPPWLAAIIEGLLEKNRSRRYPSADAALAELGRQSLLRTRSWRRRALHWAGAAALLGVLGAAVWLWNDSRRPRFFQIIPKEGGGVVALDAEGRELWKKTEVDGKFNFADLHLHGDGRQYLAAVLQPHGKFGPEWVGTLSILDAETGQSKKEAHLASAREYFPGFSDQYGTMVKTFDLDHDGTDEVLISYFHSPYWPSYTVLYEPRRDVSRVIFVCSGHHRVIGVEDLDGDGRPEVILSGINNRMGWHSAVAAVKVEPWVGKGIPSRDEMPAASSPDEFYITHNRNLLWYALGPLALPDMKSMDVDRERRALTVYFQSAPKVEIGFDGFLKAFPSPLPSGERQARRTQAYAHLREATRLLRSGRADEAFPECDMASQAAKSANDPYLAEWTLRVRGKTLVATGRLSEAEKLFRGLAKIPETGSEAAYDAGRAFHLAGHLERALAWYRQGLGRGGNLGVGRGKYEYLEGEVFCLGERGRWEEALDEVERYEASYPQQPQGAYREYIRWRTGAIPSLERLGISKSNPDLSQYWQLEFRWIRHQSAQTLLAAVDEEIERTSEAGPFLFSLRGEILGRLGRTSEALAAEQEALRRTRGSLDIEPAARVHYGLVVDRFAAAARRAGLPREAESALSELRLWKQRQSEIKD